MASHRQQLNYPYPPPPPLLGRYPPPAQPHSSSSHSAPFHGSNQNRGSLDSFFRTLQNARKWGKSNRPPPLKRAAAVSGQLPSYAAINGYGRGEQIHLRNAPPPHARHAPVTPPLLPRGYLPHPAPKPLGPPSYPPSRHVNQGLGVGSRGAAACDNHDPRRKQAARPSVNYVMERKKRRERITEQKRSRRRERTVPPTHSSRPTTGTTTTAVAPRNLARHRRSVRAGGGARLQDGGGAQQQEDGSSSSSSRKRKRRRKKNKKKKSGRDSAPVVEREDERERERGSERERKQRDFLHQLQRDQRRLAITVAAIQGMLHGHERDDESYRTRRGHDHQDQDEGDEDGIVLVHAKTAGELSSERLRKAEEDGEVIDLTHPSGS
mmetsp:Transcript_22152/g.44438  ORF Transcript_22152/g.44438 Transcript_22152/m.44438 type:complete len:379 (-) Transcript_22152:250-1386(-)